MLHPSSKVLWRYVTAGLTAARRERVRSHALACNRCRAELRRAVLATRALAQGEPDPSATDATDAPMDATDAPMVEATDKPTTRETPLGATTLAAVTAAAAMGAPTAHELEVWGDELLERLTVQEESPAQRPAKSWMLVAFAGAAAIGALTLLASPERASRPGIAGGPAAGPVTVSAGGPDTQTELVARGAIAESQLKLRVLCAEADAKGSGAVSIIDPDRQPCPRSAYVKMLAATSAATEPQALVVYAVVAGEASLFYPPEGVPRTPLTPELTPLPGSVALPASTALVDTVRLVAVAIPAAIPVDFEEMRLWAATATPGERTSALTTAGAVVYDPKLMKE